MIVLLLTVFAVGYVGIATEHNINIDKSATALLTGILCWTIFITMADVPSEFLSREEFAKHITEGVFLEHVGDIASILFFLMGAMAIVELIDAHGSFDLMTRKITTQNIVTLLWIVVSFTFILSAALDNLTSTIVMISILRKLIKNVKMRMLFVSMVVLSANAGGAWSPIGDVTTTMLWIGGQITTLAIVKSLIAPSIICIIVPTVLVSAILKRKRFELGKIPGQGNDELFYHNEQLGVDEFEKKLVFAVGVGLLLFVPIFKTLTHLPPFAGILFGLGALWLLTEILHRAKPHKLRKELSVVGVLKKVDMPSVLFFMGILLAISALDVAKILETTAHWLDTTIQNNTIVGLAIGLLSAVVDNVPLVAASMGMYSLETFPQDHAFWQFIAYCAGTGGSCLIIGSAAGVAAMGMERISFGWYFKNISFLALIGYLAGAVAYLASIGTFKI
ncbi:SLC13 family permease [Aureibacter tunicatorum]|uniref:Na+/H+ antiporter NhaD/arsenite permease-like protein n=1 Tax=Aureibacter tunicatorum TaxID=866807 RepID=A0AAE3XRV1_9BACT|nr:SLC13 family permease [Aureibacter tunicatorum]MDR6240319.1 Na+/H+ antiporter NhaD/arsenite permease-like protein [Aureibacter tunicatorum]BDD05800.1 sodium:proton antiporter [Aureibacter tunicatorum]